MSMEVSLAARILRAWLAARRKPIHMTDGDGAIEMTLDEAVAEDGLLPVLLAAGEGIWIEMFEQGFSLELESDADALCGWRVKEIGDVIVPAVVLAVMEAVIRADRRDSIVVSDLMDVWFDAVGRFEEAGVIARNALVAAGAQV